MLDISPFLAKILMAEKVWPIFSRLKHFERKRKPASCRASQNEYFWYSSYLYLLPKFSRFYWINFHKYYFEFTIIVFFSIQDITGGSAYNRGRGFNEKMVKDRVLELIKPQRVVCVLVSNELIN